MQFVFDLDGTICFRGQPVSENINQCLRELTLQGHEVLFASARPIRDILPVLDKTFHRYPIIGGNGSLISNDGNLIRVESFSENQVRQIWELLIKQNATCLIDGEWDYARFGTQDHPIFGLIDPLKLARQVPVKSLGKIVKILIVSADNMDLLEEQLAGLDVVLHQHTQENMLDITPRNVHKWSGLQHLEVREKQFVAFGNDANDISMFRHALYSVMIGHHKELAAFATETVPVTELAEQNIIEKIKELAAAFPPLQQKSGA